MPASDCLSPIETSLFRKPRSGTSCAVLSGGISFAGGRIAADQRAPVAVGKPLARAKPHAEIAVQHILKSGQILNGRIDLLLETENGLILIDHKSSQLAPDRGGN